MLAGVIEVVVPVFALIALGYAAVRRGLIDEAGLKSITLFVFGIASPALLFSGGTQPHEGGGGAALALVGSSMIFYGLLVLAATRLARMSLAEAALFALACVFGNSVMMGIPIIIAAYGTQGVPPLLAILAVQTFAILGMATVVTEIGLNARAPWRRILASTARGLLRNPIVLAVLAAILWRGLGLPVPEVLRRTLDLLGAAAPPLALFCLGGSLVGLAAAAAWRETLATAVLKLFALPVIVWGAALALRLSPIETAVAVTMAALPTGANAFILARRYATGADRSGSAVVLTTAISILTLSALIAHFRGVLP